VVAEVAEVAEILVLQQVKVRQVSVVRPQWAKMLVKTVPTRPATAVVVAVAVADGAVATEAQYPVVTKVVTQVYLD
jgi:hypothetical protein